MDDASPILAVIFLVAVLGYIWFRRRRNHALRDRVKPLEVFEVGRYLTGLPHVTSPADLTCWVSAARFLFMTSGSELVDAIPRDAVLRVIVDKKSQIT